MTDETDPMPTDDSEVGFGAHVAGLYSEDPTPAHNPNFWATIDGEFAAIGESLAATPGEAPDPMPPVLVAETSDDFAVVAQPHDELRSRRTRGSRRAPAFVAAAAAICALVGVSALWLANDRDNDQNLVVADSIAADDRLGSIQADVESTDLDPVFSVRSPVAVYMRLTSLDTFDGTIWSSSTAAAEDYESLDLPVELIPTFDDAEEIPSAEVSGDLPFVRLPPADGRHPVEVTVLNDAVLDRGYLPVPDGTLAIDNGTSGTIGYNADSRTWVFDPADEAEFGQYTVQADGTDFEQIRSISNFLTATPEDAEFLDMDLDELIAAARPDDRYFELPDGFSQRATDLATAWTASGQTDLERALLLEANFRTNFRYTTDAPTGHNLDAIEQFLTSKAGHAEQFAGTFAAMARSIGLASRVVVGYQPGERADGEEDLFMIDSQDAHAWVEIGLGQDVWVRFDPTPGRGQARFDAPQPVANRDHWHAAYGIYDCRTGNYQAPYLSTLDPLGIHSHQDGVIHIHPFFAEAAGDNARLSHFFDAMEIELSDAGLSSMDPVSADRPLPATATCDDRPAVLHLRKWASDSLVGVTAPEIIVEDFGSVRFENDREVYVIALAPLDAEVPAVPIERLDEVAANAPSS